MRATSTAQNNSVPEQTSIAERHRTTLLWMSVVRLALAAIAIPLAPFLYRHHFLILVLLRPTRLVLFFGGLLAHQGKVDLPAIIAAAVPLGLFGVWQAYALGLANERRIASGRIPSPWKRLLPARRIRRLQRALREQGTKLVILARLGTFPNYLLGTAAGSADMDARTFFVADAIGLTLEIAVSIGLGYATGGAGGKGWAVGLGFGAILLAGVIYARQFHRE